MKTSHCIGFCCLISMGDNKKSQSVASGSSCLLVEACLLSSCVYVQGDAGPPGPIGLDGAIGSQVKMGETKRVQLASGSFAPSRLTAEARHQHNENKMSASCFCLVLPILLASFLSVLMIRVMLFN